MKRCGSTKRLRRCRIRRSLGWARDQLSPLRCDNRISPQITQITQIKEKQNEEMLVKDVAASDPRTYAIIGAAMEVHKQLGCGFLEAVYQEALAIEFSKRDIPFRREVHLPIHYKGQLLSTAYCVDFICFDSVIVELKAVAQMTGTEESQVINYLKATGYEIGLLL